MTLAEFLLARIAEDEQHNLRLREKVTADLSRIKGTAVELTDDRYLRRQDAESAAKRRIVEDHQWHPDAESTTCWECAQRAPCPTMRHLGAVYADHPDYNQEWKA